MLCPDGLLQVTDTGKTLHGRYQLTGTELKVHFGKKAETYAFKSDPQFLTVRGQLLQYAGPPNCRTLTDKSAARPRKAAAE